MAVTIRLSRAGESLSPRELVLTQDIISIGREATNLLPLEHPLVSKTHARIERQGGTCRITDLKSTNGTFMNDIRLDPGREYPLHQGDRVRIADYEIELVAIDQPRSPEASRPETIGGATGTLKEWAELRAAIADRLDTFDVAGLMAREDEMRRQNEQLREENRFLKERLASMPEREKNAPPPERTVQGLDEQRMMAVTEILLGLFSKLSSGHSSFLSEFIARTVLHDTGVTAARLRLGEEATRYFADRSLSTAESAARLEDLSRNAETLVLHMMGLLEGYRRSIDEGTKRLLEQLDPDALQEGLADTRMGPLPIPYRAIPFLLDLKTIALMRRRHKDLLREDRGVLEKRFFRPGFIHGYEDCVASAEGRARHLPTNIGAPNRAGTL